jgi:hypothetical protein
MIDQPYCPCCGNTTAFRFAWCNHLGISYSCEACGVVFHKEPDGVCVEYDVMEVYKDYSKLEEWAIWCP